MMRWILWLVCIWPFLAVSRELGQDEEGIWMVVEDEERFIRTSPLRIKDDQLDQ